MTLTDFKRQMRMNRGKLSKMDAQLETIYTHGSSNFRIHMLNTKNIGLDNACNIIDRLLPVEQSELVTWIETTKPKPDADKVELKVIRIINDR